jgi:predicted kinase
MLIIFGGLSGSGKTTIARELAAQIGAVYLRVDSIEQALRDSGTATEPMNDAGYRIAYALAEENLRLGNTVVADSVNPLAVTRDAWISVAGRAGARFLEIEVVCSDLTEHRRRIETRRSDIAGLRLPSWDDVLSREYQPWQRERVVVDTSSSSADEIVGRLRALLPKAEHPRSL